jgi:hypothetical protein
MNLYLVRVRTKAKVLDSLTSILRTTEQQCVAAILGELIQSHGLATSSDNSGPGRGGEAEGRNIELGDCELAVVVRDGADYDNCPLLVLGRIGNDAGDRNGGAVNARHVQAAEDNLVEVGIGSACPDHLVSPLEVQKKSPNEQAERFGVFHFFHLRERKRYCFTNVLR